MDYIREYIKELGEKCGEPGELESVLKNYDTNEAFRDICKYVFYRANKGIKNQETKRNAESAEMG